MTFEEEPAARKVFDEMVKHNLPQTLSTWVKDANIRKLVLYIEMEGDVIEPFEIEFARIENSPGHGQLQ